MKAGDGAGRLFAFFCLDQVEGSKAHQKFLHLWVCKLRILEVVEHIPGEHFLIVVEEL